MILSVALESKWWVEILGLSLMQHSSKMKYKIGGQVCVVDTDFTLLIDSIVNN